MYKNDHRNIAIGQKYRQPKCSAAAKYLKYVYIVGILYHSEDEWNTLKYITIEKSEKQCWGKIKQVKLEYKVIYIKNRQNWMTYCIEIHT